MYQGKFVKDSNKFRRLFLHPASSPLYRLQRPWNLQNTMCFNFCFLCLMNGISLWLALTFIQSLGFLKKSWNLPSDFLDLKKVWKIEMKSGKIIKSPKFFFVFKATTRALEVKLFQFVLVKSWSISPVCLQRIKRKALFLRFSRSLLITYLIILSLGKVVVLEMSGKSLEFGSQ